MSIYGLPQYDLGRTRFAEAPIETPTLSDLAAQTWRDTTRVSNQDAAVVNLSDAFDEVNARIREATGEALDNPMAADAPFSDVVRSLWARGRQFESFQGVQTWRNRVGELRLKAPDALDWDDILDRPVRDAFERMRSVREETNAMMAARGQVDPATMPGYSVPYVGPFVGTGLAFGQNLVMDPAGTLVTLGAGFGGQMTSPLDATVNLIGFGVGGAAKSIVKNAALNAAANVAGQAILSAPKQADYEAAGLPYGWRVWAEEVAAAGIAGGILDVGIRAPIRTARFLRGDQGLGGVFRDAPAPVTVKRMPDRPDIAPEVYERARADDFEAIKEIAEKTGAIESPVVKGAIDHAEMGGAVDEQMIATLRQMGVDDGEGLRTLAAVMANPDAYVRMPEPVPAAPVRPMRAEALELAHTRGPEIQRILQATESTGAAGLRGQVAAAFEAGIPEIVEAVTKAVQTVADGQRPEDAASDVGAAFARLEQAEGQERLTARIAVHGGARDVRQAAAALRQFPDLNDDSLPPGGFTATARAIARLDDAAYAMIQRGEAPPALARDVDLLVPPEQQAQVLADLVAAGVQTAEQVKELVPDLIRRRPPEPGPAGIDDPAGPEAKRQVEVLEEQHADAIAEAMRPIEERKAAEQRVEDLKGEIARIEERSLTGGPQFFDPATGAPLARSEVDAIVDMWRYTREMQRAPQPETLSRWLMRTGRVQDQNGELTRILGGRSRHLISGRGRTLDDAALAAWEQGFFLQAERPTVDDFLEAISEDMRGNAVYRAGDMEAAENVRIAREMADDLDQLGVRNAETEDAVRAYFTAASGEGAASRQASARGPEGEAGQDADGQAQTVGGRDGGMYAIREDGTPGLDMSPEARKARAEAMGFDASKVWYHGTDSNFDSFSPDSLGKHSGELNAFSFTSSAAVADSYAGMSSTMQWDAGFSKRLREAFERRFGKRRLRKGQTKADAIEEHKELVAQAHKNDPPIRQWAEFTKDGANIMALYVKPGRQLYVDARGQLWKSIDGQRIQDIVSRAKADNYDSVLVTNVKDGGTESRAHLVADTLFIFDPRNIRSINAAFDPARADSANLLYAIADADVEAHAKLSRELGDAQADLSRRQPMGSPLYRLVMEEAALRRQLDVYRAVHAALRLADRILPPGARVEVSTTELVDPVTGRTLDAMSDTATGDITLAAYALDPQARLGHEALHTLVTRGLVSPEEIGMLAQAARDEGLFTPATEASYRAAYQGRKNIETQIAEEAAAAFVEARIKRETRGEAPQMTATERIAQAIANMIERVRNALKGYGFQTADDVRTAVLNGTMAQRKAVRSWMRSNDVTAMAVQPGMAAIREDGTPGLDMSPEARLARAEAMGFDTSKVWYHGTNAKFDAFDLAHFGKTDWGFRGKGVYLTPERDVAQRYGTNVGDYFVRGPLAEDGDPRADQLRGSAWKAGMADATARGLTDYARTESVKEFVNERLREVGYTGSFDGYELVVFDPRNIRSVNAAFDPAQTDSPNLMFAFAGERARTADLSALDRAKEMDAEGPPRVLDKADPGYAAYDKHRTKIWEETGWFRGVDGKWRWEISAGLRMTDDAVERMLGGRNERDVERRNELQRRIEEILDERVELAPEDDADLRWSFIDDSAVAVILDGERYVAWTLPSEPNVLRVKMSSGSMTDREVFRFKADDVEQMAPGELAQLVNVNYQRWKLAEDFDETPKFARAMSDDPRYRQLHLEQAELREELRNVREAISAADRQEVYGRFGGLLDAPETVAAYPNLAKSWVTLRRSQRERFGAQIFSQFETVGRDEFEIVSIAEHETQHIVQDAEGFAVGTNPDNAGSFERYRAFAGEVEARTVQKRMGMTPEQRRARPPWRDYDVPESEQIVRFANDKNASLYAFSEEPPIKGFPTVKKTGSGVMYAITGYNGSPNDFNRFDSRYIGTGEGGAMQGVGFYFSTDPEYASWYRDPKLEGNENQGHLYKVTIHADDADFLEWDKSLENQSPKVLTALQQMIDRMTEDQLSVAFKDFYKGATGGALAFALDRALPDGYSGQVNQTGLGGPNKNVSDFLLSLGIKGVRYVEKYNNTENYVVFDESIIEIVAKDGQPVTPTERAQVVNAMTSQDDGGAPEAMYAIADAETGRSMRRDLDALGYYSQALEAARRLKQAKGTPEQMLSQLKKVGVKDAEIAATGLKAYLDDKDKMPLMEGVPIEYSLRERANYLNLQEVQALRAAWDQVQDQPVIDVPIEQLVATQPDVDPEQVAIVRERLSTLEDVPSGYLWKGRVYIEDGHHRAAAYAMEGSTVPMKVFDLDRYISENEIEIPKQELPSVTRDEIVAHLEQNRVELRESRYAGGKTRISFPDSLSSQAKRYLEKLQDKWGDDSLDNSLLPDIVRSDREMFEEDGDVPVWFDEVLSAIDRGDVVASGGPTGADAYLPAAKWSDYSLDPSNPTYRETVLHLPESADNLRERRMAELDRIVAAYGHLRNAPEEERAAFEALSDQHYQQRPDRIDFQSGHFPEPNIVGHMMTSMVKHEGQPVYLIDQIQSDWGQKLRDGGVRDEAKIAELKAKVDAKRVEVLVAYVEADRAVRAKEGRGEPLTPASYSDDRARLIVREGLIRTMGDAANAMQTKLQGLAQDERLLRAELRTAEAATPGNPLVNTTDQWVNTTLRRAVRQAAEADAQFIAIPHGDTVLSYNPGDEGGMRGFYGSRTSEGIVPKNLRKLLEKLDKGSAEPLRIDELETPTQGMKGEGFTVFPLTDTVKQRVMTEGQAMFAIADDVTARDLEAVRGKAPPIVVYRRHAQLINAALPPPKDRHTRLWRGNRPGEVTSNPSFTNSLDGIALPFRQMYGGQLSYVDVPTERLSAYELTEGTAKGSEFEVPPSVAAKATPIDLDAILTEQGSPMFSIGDSPPPPEPPPPLHADMEAVDRWGVLRDMIIACRG